MTYEDMVGKVACGENFVFSRWGDGEWAALLGKRGMNCDGCWYYQDLGERLEQVLFSRPTYYLGMQDKAMNDMGFEINGWLNGCGLRFNWCDADIMHKASIDDKIQIMTGALSRRNVVMVGPRSLYGLKLGEVIVVPPRNCWRAYASILHECIKRVARDIVFCLSFSMASNVLAHDLYDMFGDDITVIDCGSVWQPYVSNNPTRMYHKGIIKRNSND